MRKVAYLAIDHGPRLTLEALAARLPGEWLDAAAQCSRALSARGVELLICGTSDSAAARELEAGARSAAAALGVPTVLVEDFPGNFSAAPAPPPRLLVVESAFAADLARRKVPGLRVHIGPSLRYDTVRSKLDSLRSARASDVRDAVLWIGQPETADALRTLDALMPALRARHCALWFRAHPRDAGYARAVYASLPIEDMTARPLDECLARRPRLVITQFSSVAVGAGFWGIPSLNVLLSDAGSARLLERKGYARPPWCDAGAAFVAQRASEIESVLTAALDSESARRGVLARFDEYFKVREDGVPALINVLYNQGLLQ